MRKVRKFYKSGYETLKLSITAQGSSVIIVAAGESSENICSSSGGAQERGKIG
jgi:hypothetical protein